MISQDARQTKAFNSLSPQEQDVYETVAHLSAGGDWVHTNEIIKSLGLEDGNYKRASVNKSLKRIEQKLEAANNSLVPPLSKLERPKRLGNMWKLERKNNK